MTTYAIEEIQRLNASLLELQRAHLCNATSVSTLSAPSGNNTQFLLAANQSLDAMLVAMPNLDDIDTHLTQYLSLDKDGDATLEWLFITKCTLAIYGHSLSSIVHSTLPLSESLAYWDSIHGNTWYEVYYGIQTAPRRCYDLMTTSWRRGVSFKQWTCSDHLVGCLFPMALRVKTTLEDHRPGKFMVHVFRKLYNAPLPLALVRDEVQQKRTTLRLIRARQATTLGLLIKQAPRFDNGGLLETEEKHAIRQVASGTMQCVKALTTCFSVDLTGDMGCPRQLAKALKRVVDRQPRYEQEWQVWKQLYGPPSVWTRYWLPGLAALLAGQMTLTYVVERKQDILDWMQSGLETVREFLVHWLWEPTKGILETIRFQDRRIGLSSKEGLKSDAQSLERMVIQFAKNYYDLSDADIIQLVSQVREGDISRVLLAYENEIKNPLRNAIQGDLIQALLIQVQKTKVDVDMAMQALDKLLKSNELNFAFLAVAPSMLLAWAFVCWIKNMYQKRDGHRIRHDRPLKATLRRIERLFTLDTNGDDELGCESQGVLLCELLLLRNYAQYLPTRHSIRELFIEDIRDLETVRLSKKQKKETIGRMYHSWKFLS